MAREKSWRRQERIEAARDGFFVWRVGLNRQETAEVLGIDVAVVREIEKTRSRNCDASYGAGVRLIERHRAVALSTIEF